MTRTAARTEKAALDLLVLRGRVERLKPPQSIGVRGVEMVAALLRNPHAGACVDFDVYSTEFSKALDNTERLDLPRPKTESRPLTPQEVAQAWARQQQLQGVFGVERVALNCASVHATQRHILKTSAAGLQPVLTVGWVKYEGEHLWEATFKQLRAEIRRNRKKRAPDPASAHAWLTVMTAGGFQILDFTLPCYLFMKGLCEQPNLWLLETGELPEGHEMLEYHPVLTGQSTLEALNFLDVGWSPV